LPPNTRAVTGSFAWPEIGKTGFGHYAPRAICVKLIGHKITKIKFEKGRDGSRGRIGRPSFRFVLKRFAILHYEGHVFEDLYISQRIAVHSHDIGIGAGRDYADLALHLQHLGGA